MMGDKGAVHVLMYCRVILHAILQVRVLHGGAMHLKRGWGCRVRRATPGRGSTQEQEGAVNTTQIRTR